MRLKSNINFNNKKIYVRVCLLRCVGICLCVGVEYEYTPCTYVKCGLFHVILSHNVRFRNLADVKLNFMLFLLQVAKFVSEPDINLKVNLK